MFQRPTVNSHGRPLFCAPWTRTWHLIAVALTASLSVHGQSAGSDKLSEQFSPIKVQLVAEQVTFQPGVPFYVGFHQSIQPGYHTYWRNAGTVGLPSSIEWILPEGYSASPLLWPVPEVSQMVDYKVWGYRKETLLIAKITPPTELPLDASVPIKAKASWMCCGKQCHPGFEALELELKASAKAQPDPNWQPAFEQVRLEQPRVFEQWSISATRADDRYLLTLTTRHPLPSIAPESIQYFGFHRQVSSAKPQSVKQLPDGFLLTLYHEEFSGEDRTTLSGMLVANAPWDLTHPKSPLLIEVPLKNAPTP